MAGLLFHRAMVPVLVLSATLAPAQRQALFKAYMTGAASREELRVKVPMLTGHPSRTTAWLSASGEPQFNLDVTDSWREEFGVVVRVVPETVRGARSSREERERLQGGGMREWGTC
ncbi:hypothetical protein [Streptomyces luteogriseus]|uniref:hypothetical protein n=1 Tax=Streptomyces luteogriseus TaxID=68233 RepID=UPI0037F83A74